MGRFGGLTRGTEPPSGQHRGRSWRTATLPPPGTACGAIVSWKMVAGCREIKLLQASLIESLITASISWTPRAPWRPKRLRPQSRSGRCRPEHVPGVGFGCATNRFRSDKPDKADDPASHANANLGSIDESVLFKRNPDSLLDKDRSVVLQRSSFDSVDHIRAAGHPPGQQAGEAFRRKARE